MNYKEFSSKIKSKYPDYADMDDRELAERMVKKYPEYSDVSFDEVTNAPQDLHRPLDASNGLIDGLESVDPSLEMKIEGDNPAKMALSAAAETLGLSPTTSPVQGVVNALTGPAKLSNQLGKASEPAAGYVAEELGKRGANPYVAATAGMAAGIAADPRSFVPGPKVTGPRPLNRAVNQFPSAKFKEAMTGVEERSFNRLYNDPDALSLKGTLKEAGTGIAAAKQEAGVNLGITEDPSSFTPENLKRVQSINTIGRNSEMAVAEKMQQGIDPTPEEVSEAINYVSRKLDKTRPGTQEYQNLTVRKGHLNTVLESVSKPIQEARGEYARRALRDEFDPLLPVNKNGTYSKVSAVYLPTVAGAGGGAIGSFVGGPQGAAVGSIVGAIGSQVVRSPNLWGRYTAAASKGSRYADSALSSIESNATRRGVIDAYISREGTRRLDRREK